MRKKGVRKDTSHFKKIASDTNARPPLWLLRYVQLVISHQAQPHGNNKINKDIAA
jgi:hypothetical protein